MSVDVVEGGALTDRYVIQFRDPDVDMPWTDAVAGEFAEQAPAVEEFERRAFPPGFEARLVHRTDVTLMEKEQ